MLSNHHHSPKGETLDFYMAEITLWFHVGFLSILCLTCWNPCAARLPEDLTKWWKCDMESGKVRCETQKERDTNTSWCLRGARGRLCVTLGSFSLYLVCLSFVVSRERLTRPLYTIERRLYVDTSNTKWCESLLSVGTQGLMPIKIFSMGLRNR